MRVLFTIWITALCANLLLSSAIAQTANPAPTPEAQAAVAPMNDAVDALGKGDLDTAEAKFREAAKAAPSLAAPWLGLAKVASQRGDAQGAEADIKKAIEIEPKSVVAHEAMASLLAANKDFTGAIAEYDEAASLDPKNPAPLIEKGVIYALALKDLPKATAALRAARDIDPNKFDGHYWLGRSLMEAGQVPEALSELNQATKIAPDNPAGWLALAEANVRTHDLDSALKNFDKAAELAPKSVDPVLGRGQVLSQQGKGDEAIAAYTKALEIDKRSTLALALRADEEEKANRPDDAERDYRAAIEINPKGASAYNNLAFMLATQKKNLDDALAFAKKANELVPDHPDLRDTLAWVYMARGEYADAEKILVPLVKKTPKAEYNFHLGLLYVATGKKKEAIAALDKAIELAPTFQEARDARDRLIKK
jgi:tetratricopeptide (TPR) repeat protein